MVDRSVDASVSRRSKNSSARSRTRKERDYYQYSTRHGLAGGGSGLGMRMNGGTGPNTTSWSTVACVFISMTLLLATALGGILYQSYEAKLQAHSRDMFLDAKSGGAAEAFLFLREKDRKSVGIVRFYAEDSNVRVVAELTNLKRNTEHAFHIYQYTDPVDNDIGEILNPKRKPHGCPGISAEYRMGDLGNVKANALGVAMYDSKLVGATIADIVGRSVVIHEQKDDCISQPVGNSGEFLAEGVISLGNPTEITSKLPADKSDGRLLLPASKDEGAGARPAMQATPTSAYNRNTPPMIVAPPRTVGDSNPAANRVPLAPRQPPGNGADGGLRRADDQEGRNSPTKLPVALHARPPPPFKKPTPPPPQSTNPKGGGA
jgi:Cu-Zn family superoxide dismutase